MFRTCTQTTFIGEIKMLLPLVLVLAVFSQFSTSSVITDKVNPEFRSHFQRATGFGESVREWFNSMKNKLFGRSQVLDTRELLDLDKAELMQRIDHPGNFFVDVSRLRFDSEFDWGFHIGHWYFIRKGDQNSNHYGSDYSTEWNFSPSASTDELQGTSEEGDNGQEEEHVGRTTTPKLEWTTQETDAPELLTTEAKREEDNETQNEFIYSE